MIFFPYTQQAFAFHLLRYFCNVHDHIVLFLFLFFRKILLLLSFSFVMIYIIHKIFLLLKNHLNYLKDNLFECFFKKKSFLFFSFYSIFFYTQQAFVFHFLRDFYIVHDHIVVFFFFFFTVIFISFKSNEFIERF